MRLRVGLGFGALCLLAGTGPVLDGIVPEAPAGLVGAAVRLAALALVFGLIGLRARGGWGGWRVLVWGGVLVAGLPILFAGGAGRVSGPTEFLVFALIPAAVVFFEAQRRTGFGVDRGAFGLMGPALAGLGGAALLLSYAMPSSAVGKAWLGGMMLAAGVAGWAVVKLHEGLAGVSVARGAALVCAGGAGLCLSFCWVGWGAVGSFDWVSAGRLVVLDGPAMWLTVWLLREMGAVGFSARYLLGLLVAVGESFLLARAGLTWTIGLGVALVVGGAVVLLRAEDEVGGEGVSEV